MPTTVVVGPSSRVSSDPMANPFSASAALTTTSPADSGQRPEVTSKRPSTRGEATSSSVGLGVDHAASRSSTRTAPSRISAAGTSRPSVCRTLSIVAAPLAPTPRRALLVVEALQHLAGVGRGGDPRV